MLSSICFSNKVVLYWDLPENYKVGNKYVISMDGKKICETEKCHIEIKNLSPESEYNFLVEMVGDSSLNIGEAILKTEKEKEKSISQRRHIMQLVTVKP